MFLAISHLSINLVLYHLWGSIRTSILVKFGLQNRSQIGLKSIHEHDQIFNRKNDPNELQNGSKNGSQRRLFLRRRGPGVYHLHTLAPQTLQTPFWERFGSDLEPLWLHLGALWGPFWDHFGASLGPVWGRL